MTVIVIKLFSLNKLECFVPDKLLQSILLVKSKARVYLYSPRNIRLGCKGFVSDKRLSLFVWKISKKEKNKKFYKIVTKSQCNWHSGQLK